MVAQRGGKGIEENEGVEQGINYKSAQDNFLEDGNICISGCGDGLQRWFQGCINLWKPIKLSTLHMCSLFYFYST